MTREKLLGYTWIKDFGALSLSIMDVKILKNLIYDMIKKKSYNN